MARCQIYAEEEAIWAFQPFGPSEDVTQMAMIGSHYRGFPVIKIGELARQKIEHGERIAFAYRGVRYFAVNHEVITEADYWKPILEQHERKLAAFRNNN